MELIQLTMQRGQGLRDLNSLLKRIHNLRAIVETYTPIPPNWLLWGPQFKIVGSTLQPTASFQNTVFQP